MKKAAEEYFRDLARLMDEIRVTGAAGERLGFFEGVEEAAKLINAQAAAGRKLIFIGNGASAAFASHMSTDFWKNGGIRAVAFNDGSLLTCIGNDFGYRHVFEKPIEMFADKGDVLVAISSSGRSENILLGAEAARGRGCKVITLSGFRPDNPLSSMGDVNFYVPAESYGPVEIIHQAVCHGILDIIMAFREG